MEQDKRISCKNQTEDHRGQGKSNQTQNKPEKASKVSIPPPIISEV